MIVCLSTSSPVTSVAIIEKDGAVLAAESEYAPQSASEKCIGLLDRCLYTSGKSLGDVKLLVADIGPGSFTGVKVAVAMVKAIAYSLNVPTAGVSSFDLIEPQAIALIPSRRGEWLMRVPGQSPILVHQLIDAPFKGYGNDISEPTFPKAENLRLVLDKLDELSPFELVPRYILEPSISKPKKAYKTGGANKVG